jgi:hypothetical protein
MQRANIYSNVMAPIGPAMVKFLITSQVRASHCHAAVLELDGTGGTNGFHQ